MLFLYIEINLLGIAILLLLFMSRNQFGTASLDERLFNWILMFAAVIILADTGMWVFDKTTYRGGRLLNIASSAVSFLALPGSGFLWLLYSDYMLHRNMRTLKKRLHLYAIPVAICVLATGVSYFNGWAFTVSPENVYSRGKLFMVVLALSLFYLVYASFLALQKAKTAQSKAEKREYYLIAAFPIPPFVGAIVQYMFYGVSLIPICAVFSLLMIFINIQNRQISTDALTGINNRRRMNRHLESRTAMLQNGAQLYAIILDVDHFKGINDTFGHAAGDAALVQAADILKAACSGKSDFLARMGGDEFIILLQRDSRESVAEVMAEINRRVDEFNESKKAPYRLSFSMGSARYGDLDTCSIDAFLSKADQNMYLAKSRQRGSGAFVSDLR